MAAGARTAISAPQHSCEQTQLDFSDFSNCGLEAGYFMGNLRWTQWGVVLPAI